MGIPRMSMSMTMKVVNMSLRGRKYLGQLSTRPTMRDSRMQNCESKPSASSIMKKRIDQKGAGLSWSTTCKMDKGQVSERSSQRVVKD